MIQLTDEVHQVYVPDRMIAAAVDFLVSRKQQFHIDHEKEGCVITVETNILSLRTFLLHYFKALTDNSSILGEITADQGRMTLQLDCAYWFFVASEDDFKQTSVCGIKTQVLNFLSNFDARIKPFLQKCAAAECTTMFRIDPLQANEWLKVWRPDVPVSFESFG